MTGLREKLSDSTRSLRDVFRNPGLRRLQLAFAGSIVGDWAYAVAVAVYAYDHGGATAVGVLGVIRYVSLAVVTPFTSVLGDRYPRRLVMVCSDRSRAALVVAAAVVIAAHGPTARRLRARDRDRASAARRSEPPRRRFCPSSRPSRPSSSAANVASSTIESVGFFAGPALAGSDAGGHRRPRGLRVRRASRSSGRRRSSSVSASRSRGGRPAPEESGGGAGEDKEGFLAEASAGYREILGSRDLRLLVGLYCAQTVVAGASLVFTVSIALSLLDIGRSGLGFLNATLGIGGLIGGFLALVLAQRGRLARDFGVGVILWSAPLLLVAAWPTVAAAVAVMIASRARELDRRRQRASRSCSGSRRRRRWPASSARWRAP